MTTRFEHGERRRKRNRRVASGLLASALGLAAALALSLTIFTDNWAKGGAVIGGAALVLLGLRVVAGKRWGGEIMVAASLLVAVAAIVVAIVLDAH